MGRRFPASENSSTHPPISFPLLVASLMATIALVTALCGARIRKKSSPPSTSSSPYKTTDKSQTVTSPSTTMATTTTPMMPSPPSALTSTADLEDKTEKKIEIPQLQESLKPPPMRQLRESSSYSCGNSNSTKETGLKTSMSLRVPRSLSVAKNQSRKEERQQKKKDKLKGEESVWMKTIILGEKCRVPDDDDTIIYDDKGNRISTFHPKTPRSLPPSRQCSFIDHQAIPS